MKWKEGRQKGSKARKMALYPRANTVLSLPLLLHLLLQLASTFLPTADCQRGHRSFVLELTADTLAAAIKKHDVIMVEFYAPWCGHCQRLAPEYDRASQILSQQAPHVKLAKIDADKYRAVLSEYELGGYPTLRLYTNGIATDTEYQGPRTAEAIASYVKRSLIPAISTLSSESEVATFVGNASDDSPIFIGFGLEASVLEDLAKKHRRKAWFAVFQNASEKLMRDFDFDKVPALVGLHPKVDEQEVFYGSFEGGDLVDFVQQYLLPLLSPIEDPECVTRLREDGRPIAIGILESKADDRFQSFIKKLKAAAPANRAFVFAYVDASKWPDFVRPFGIEKTSLLPTVVIWNGESEFSIHDDLQAFVGADAETQLTRFLQDFREHRVKLRTLVELSLLQRAKQMVFGTPTLIVVCSVIILVFVLQGCNWSALAGDGEHSDDHRERGRRTDLEGDIMGDRGLSDSSDHHHIGRKSEKRD